MSGEGVSVRVFARFRPLNAREIRLNPKGGEKGRHMKYQGNDQVTVAGNTFTFDRIFDSNSEQHGVYDASARAQTPHPRRAPCAQPSSPCPRSVCACRTASQGRPIGRALHTLRQRTLPCVRRARALPTRIRACEPCASPRTPWLACPGLS